MKLRKQLKNITVGPNQGKRYMLEIVRGEQISLNTLCELIAELSTVHRSDVKAVFDVVGTALLIYLAEGHSVKIDDFGIFSLRLNASTEENHQDLTIENIDNIRIGFLADVELKEKIKDIRISIEPYKPSDSEDQ